LDKAGFAAGFIIATQAAIPFASLFRRKDFAIHRA